MRSDRGLSTLPNIQYLIDAVLTHSSSVSPPFVPHFGVAKIDLGGAVMVWDRGEWCSRQCWLVGLGYNGSAYAYKESCQPRLCLIGIEMVPQRLTDRVLGLFPTKATGRGAWDKHFRVGMAKERQVRMAEGAMVP